MSSIFILNKSNDRATGSGLPVYDNLNHIFSFSNGRFQLSEGLISVPNDKIPPFQVAIPSQWITLESFVYRETKGYNNFTGLTFSPPLSVMQNVRSVNINGTDYNIWQVLDSTTLAPVAPDGKFIIEFTFNNGTEDTKTYYTEEFTTTY